MKDLWNISHWGGSGQGSKCQRRASINPNTHAGGEGRGHSLKDGVCVQVHTGDVGGGHVEVKVAGVHAHDEGAGGAEHVGQGQRAQRDVGTWPVEREYHLDGESVRGN